MNENTIITSEFKGAMEEAITWLGTEPMFGTIRALNTRMHEEPDYPGRDGVKSFLPLNVTLVASMGKNDEWDSRTSINNLNMMFFNTPHDNIVLWGVKDGKPDQRFFGDIMFAN